MHLSLETSKSIWGGTTKIWGGIAPECPPVATGLCVRLSKRNSFCIQIDYFIAFRSNDLALVRLR